MKIPPWDITTRQFVLCFLHADLLEIDKHRARRDQLEIRAVGTGLIGAMSRL